MPSKRLLFTLPLLVALAAAMVAYDLYRTLPVGSAEESTVVESDEELPGSAPGTDHATARRKETAPEHPVVDSMGTFLEAFIEAATQRIPKQMRIAASRARATLQQRTGSADLALAVEQAGQWLLADNASGNPLLRHPAACAMILADFLDESVSDTSAIRSYAAIGQPGSSQHRVCAALLATLLLKDEITKMYGSYAAMLDRDPLALMARLDELYGKRPVLARGLVAELLRRGLPRRKLLGPVGALYRNDVPETAIALTDMVALDYLSLERDPRMATANLAMNLGRATAAALHLEEPVESERRSRQDESLRLLVQSLRNGDASIMQEISLIECLNRGRLPEETAIWALQRLSAGANGFYAQETAWQRLAPRVPPRELVLAADFEIHSSFDQETALRTTGLTGALIRSYSDSGGQDAELVATIFGQLLANPARDEWSRIVQTSLLQQLPDKLAGMLSRELTSLATYHAEPQLANLAQQALARIGK